MAKCVILDKYLKSYLDIMKKPENWSGQKWYVDTHAGTGFSRELGAFIPGSALRALRHDFDRFYLYEQDESRFELLVETLNEESRASLTFNEVEREGGENIRTAWSANPYVRIMNMDSNEGVSWLVDQGRRNAHWFVFVDPEGFSVERGLMEQLCNRGYMDILFNFQTSGYYRNARESADHSREAIKRNLGEEVPTVSSPDELVEWYMEDVFEAAGWKAASRPMVSEGSSESWRYDLVFASEKSVAMKIIGDVFDSDLRNDVTTEIREWRSRIDVEQQGMEAFGVRFPDDDGDDGQSYLSEY